MAKILSGLHAMGTLAMLLGLPPGSERTTFVILGACGASLAALAAFRRGLGLAVRAWLIIGPSTFAALLAFTRIGVLAGPSALLTLTLTLGGLLLGVRVQIGLAVVSFAWLLASAFAVVRGWLPAPSPAVSNVMLPFVWARTVTSMALSTGGLAWLVTALVERLDQSIVRANEEGELREAAEKARLEAERRGLEAQRLESVGRLAAGVAHDFNNNLTTIVGCAEVLALKLSREGRNEPLLEDIVTAAQRSAELTQQLLVYSRKAQMLRAPIALNELVDEVVRMFQRTTGPEITVTVALSPTPLIVDGDAARMQSALLNLFVNSRDAMACGGTLSVSTSERVLGADSGLAPGRYARVEIADTGEGIGPEALPKIFEPFFTTKPTGKGTGLGLAAVAGTVRAHGGSVQASSELGRGTTIGLLLPCSASSQPTSIRRPSFVPQGKGEILVVDDDALACQTAVEALRSLGYGVSQADSGPAALARVKASSRPFDLVILDLRMPGMSGERTFEALRELDPRLPVMIWSGYADGQDVQGMLQRGACAFLQKPYSVQALAIAVAGALRGPSEA